MAKKRTLNTYGYLHPSYIPDRVAWIKVSPEYGPEWFSIPISQFEREQGVLAGPLEGVRFENRRKHGMRVAKGYLRVNIKHELKGFTFVARGDRKLSRAITKNFKGRYTEVMKTNRWGAGKVGFLLRTEDAELARIAAHGRVLADQDQAGTEWVAA